MRVKLLLISVLQEHRYKDAGESIPLSQIIIPGSITEKKKGEETGHNSGIEELPPPKMPEKKRKPTIVEVEDLDSDVELLLI